MLEEGRLGAALGAALGEAAAERAADTVAADSAVQLALGLAEEEAAAEPVKLGEAVAHTEALAEPVWLALPVGLGVWVRVALEVPLPLRQALTVKVGLPVALPLRVGRGVLLRAGVTEREEHSDTVRPVEALGGALAQALLVAAAERETLTDRVPLGELVALGVPSEERVMEGYGVAVKADEVVGEDVLEEASVAVSIGEAEKDAEPDSEGVDEMVGALERDMLAVAVLKLDANAEAVEVSWEDLEPEEILDAISELEALSDGEGVLELIAVELAVSTGKDDADAVLVTQGEVKADAVFDAEVRSVALTLELPD